MIGALEQLPLSSSLHYQNHIYLVLVMEGNSNSSQLSTTDLLTRRFLYHMWRMDDAARRYPGAKDGEDNETMKNRWEIGLTYELVSLEAMVASEKLTSC